VILSFVGAAFLTPDVISMILMAIPLMVLYEIGILGARFLTRRKAPPEAVAEKPNA
jgi:sec-independent protein translocase protein TatC